MDHEPMDNQESENLNEHQPNNWESNVQEPNNWELNQQESNNWELNQQEPNNWELNQQESNNWELNQQESNNWELNQQEPNNSELNQQEPNEPYNWVEQEPYYWDEQEADYNEWDGTFDEIFHCYPLSAIDKTNFENGGKVIMPPSALSLLASLAIAYPMLFELRNPSDGKVSHCGVQEFTPDSGNIYMPKLMMENMHLQEGDSVNVRSIELSRGTYVKLQPHTKDFLEISNPKVILEFSLRDYFCLTRGDTIMIAYNNKQYYIDIVETKPSDAVSIIETDCEVDFVQPLDYEEPEKQLLSATSSDKDCTEVEDSVTKSAKITPFTGSARRLDDKPCTQSVEETSSSTPKEQQTENETKNFNLKTRGSKPGKLVFGSNVNVPKASTKKNTTEESSKEKEELPKFQAFSGKKYSLMD